MVWHNNVFHKLDSQTRLADLSATLLKSLFEQCDSSSNARVTIIKLRMTIDTIFLIDHKGCNL